MRKYTIGDIVTITKDPHNKHLVQPQIQYCGKKATIVDITEFNYQIDLDGGKWYWNDTMLEEGISFENLNIEDKFKEFKEGDILYVKTATMEYVFKFKNLVNTSVKRFFALALGVDYAFWGDANGGAVCDLEAIKMIRKANFEEIDKLRVACAKNNIDWNESFRLKEKLENFSKGDCLQVNNEYIFIFKEVKDGKIWDFATYDIKNDKLLMTEQGLISVNKVWNIRPANCEELNKLCDSLDAVEYKLLAHKSNEIYDSLKSFKQGDIVFIATKNTPEGFILKFKEINNNDDICRFYSLSVKNENFYSDNAALCPINLVTQARLATPKELMLLIQARDKQPSDSIEQKNVDVKNLHAKNSNMEITNSLVFISGTENFTSYEDFFNCSSEELVNELEDLAITLKQLYKGDLTVLEFVSMYDWNDLIIEDFIKFYDYLNKSKK